MNRWFLGFFLAALWPSVFTLCAEEPLPDAASSKQAVSSAPAETTPGIDSAVQTAQEEVRDPFAIAPENEVLPVMVGPEIKVELQGIGFGSKDAYAVMGGEVFYKGDMKNGIKLLEVRRREVDILVNGGKITVLLFPDQELQKAKDRAEKKSAVGNASAGQPSKTPPTLSGRGQPMS